jgi:hypothetical protein
MMHQDTQLSKWVLHKKTLWIFPHILSHDHISVRLRATGLRTWRIYLG